MTDRPIIFSAPMVRALLAGRKTQTRRVLNPQPPERPAPNCHPLNQPLHKSPYLDAYCGEPRTESNPRGMSRDWHWWQVDDRPGPVACRVPCAPGDRLWVKEAHAFVPASAYRNSLFVEQRTDPHDPDRAAIYREGFDRSTGGIRWRPSIHMPRWASRLTLHVTEVRVQRLQEISAEDVAAEGACELAFVPPSEADTAEARAVFRNLWNSLHGPDAWNANPWVCAISFEVERANIDAAKDTIDG